MQTVLTLLLALTLAAGLAGCGGSKKEKKAYREPPISRLPFVYKMTVQQGNIINEEDVDALQLGMTKSQVRYVLGTPALESMFHSDRWDYTYTVRQGHRDMELKRLVLLFQEDQLVDVQGHLTPNPARAANREPQQIVVSVPDWEDNRGFIRKSLSKVGLESKR